MKELERVNVRLDLDERNREIEGILDGRRHPADVEIVERERLKHPNRQFDKRPRREPRELPRLPAFDRFGHVQTAVRREPLDDRGLE